MANWITIKSQLSAGENWYSDALSTEGKILTSYIKDIEFSSVQLKNVKKATTLEAVWSGVLLVFLL